MTIKSQNLLVSAAIHPSIHDDLLKIKNKLTTVRNGGTKTFRVRLALFLASRLTDQELKDGAGAMMCREFLGDSGAG